MAGNGTFKSMTPIQNTGSGGLIMHEIHVLHKPDGTADALKAALACNSISKYALLPPWLSGCLRPKS